MAKDRKQKHIQKRQQKRRMQQRASTNSPHRLAAKPGEIEGCYINKHWKEDGMAAIHVLKRVGSSHVMVCFLVDTLCLGLKDAWGRLNIGPVSFREAVQEYGRSVEMVGIQPALAWRLVAGGVRVAQDNGFRLPPRYERWITILGDPAQCASADVSDFGDEDGKLHYIGPPEELHKRLVGRTLEEFMARGDVEVTTEELCDEEFDSADDDDLEDDGLEDDDDELDVAEFMQAAEAQQHIDSTIADLNQRTLDAVRRWLLSQSIEPHPRLADAVNMQLEAMLQAGSLGEELEEEKPSRELTEQVDRNLEQLLLIEPPESREELADALEQYVRFVQQFESPDALFEAIGIDPLDETEE